MTGLRLDLLSCDRRYLVLDSAIDRQRQPVSKGLEEEVGGKLVPTPLKLNLQGLLEGGLRPVGALSSRP